MIRVNTKILLAIVLGFAVGAVSAAGMRLSQKDRVTTAGVVLQNSGQAEIGRPFRLVDQAGQEFTDRHLAGKPSLVVFGYTRSDITSAALNVISQAGETAGGAKTKAVRLIFVSLDWERDTPELLKSYLQRFSPNIIGLSGSEEEIRQVASAFKVFLEREISPDGSIAINHSQLAFAFDSHGAYLSLLRLPTSVAAVVTLLNTLAE